jgi:hypothetical protein
MAGIRQQTKKPRGGGPVGHPSNQGPPKGASGAPGRGGNKVRQGKGSDTGNKGRT